jgi:two-component system chemotaxis response regulator CheB
MTRRIRVLVAEDSLAMREALMLLLREDPRLDVVGCAVDGIEAVEMVRSLRPDVVTMDIVMPRQDGLRAISVIMSEVPCRILVISSATDHRQVDLAIAAMAAGALDVIAKPTGSRPELLRAWARHVADSIALMSEVPIVRRRRLCAPQIDIFGIVASTGGPLAIAVILGKLTPKISIPIVVAQHITLGFGEGLVRWLRQQTPLRIVLGDSGMRCEAGTVYFPPDGFHLTVDRDGRLRPERAGDGESCPSGDVLLSSLARSFAARAGGAVLTGMGRDGAQGLSSIQKAGGITIAQTAASCVVPGMPEAAMAMCPVGEVLDPGEIALAIQRHAAGRPL